MMDRKQTTCTLVAIALAVMVPTAFAHAPGAIPASAPASTLPPSSLEVLAQLFAEAPASTRSASEDASCGSEGHCAFTKCNIPSCSEGFVGVCDCVSAGGECEDTHAPFWPFDDDTHTIYNCSCSCKDSAPPPEPPCDVYHPVYPDKCLIRDVPVAPAISLEDRVE